MPIAWAAKNIILNLLDCTGPAWDVATMGLPPGVPSAAAIAPSPNEIQVGCPYFRTSIVPGAPALYWGQYAFFSQRYDWSFELRWEGLRNLAFFILAYRLAAIAAWRLHYGRAKA